jgi:hypothetical protein
VALLSMLMLTVVTLGAPVTAEGNTSPTWGGVAPKALSAPYSEWKVEFRPADESGGYTLTFNSPTLGQRITNSVYVPVSYTRDGTPSPVMYYLHGTVFSETDTRALGIVGSLPGLLLVKVVSTGGGFQQTKIFDFPSQLTRARFVLVAPDTDPTKAICHTCLWGDGRPGGRLTMQSDTFLHQELYPLVQALLNVREDAAGRGVMGFSMGGWAALLQAEWHPDAYAFAASVSGVIEAVNDPFASPLFQAAGYVRDQGYGPSSITHPVSYAMFNPTDMASNLSSFDGTLLASNGDACVPPTSATAPDCIAHPALLNPDASWAELEIQHNNDAYLATIAAAHSLSRFVSPGVHGGNARTTYAEHIVPAANDAFARRPAPEVVTYKSGFDNFEVWGYEVSLTRPTRSFTNLADARLDGRAFSLSGQGRATIKTPPGFEPSFPYRATVSCNGAAKSVSQLTSGPSGRIGVTLDLPKTGDCSVNIS